jgi:hypothetical protein
MKNSYEIFWTPLPFFNLDSKHSSWLKSRFKTIMTCCVNPNLHYPNLHLRKEFLKEFLKSKLKTIKQYCICCHVNVNLILNKNII